MSAWAEGEAEDPFLTQVREEMVERQLRRRGISDRRVLEAMRKVPRHRFVPPPLCDRAYSDSALPLPHGQSISQPYMVALMTEVLALKRRDKVLEIGSGCGYQTAILAELAGEVFSLEIIPELVEMAAHNLVALGYKNAHVRLADGYYGWEEKAPFDGIMVTCAVPEVPQPLVDQLKADGRLVAPVGEYHQVLEVVEPGPGGRQQRHLAECVFVPMTGDGVRGSRPSQKG